MIRRKRKMIRGRYEKKRKIDKTVKTETQKNQWNGEKTGEVRKIKMFKLRRKANSTK